MLFLNIYCGLYGYKEKLQPIWAIHTKDVLASNNLQFESWTARNWKRNLYCSKWKVVNNFFCLYFTDFMFEQIFLKKKILIAVQAISYGAGDRSHSS